MFFHCASGLIWSFRASCSDWSGSTAAREPLIDFCREVPLNVLELQFWSKYLWGYVGELKPEETNMTKSSIEYWHRTKPTPRIWVQAAALLWTTGVNMFHGLVKSLKRRQLPVKMSHSWREGRCDDKYRSTSIPKKCQFDGFLATFDLFSIFT